MSKTVKGIMLALYMTLLISGQLEAAEYFVNKQGADTNDGSSPQKSFLTVQKGVDALNAGDRLTIGPGEYLGAVRRTKLGSADKETVIRAEIPGTVLLRGDVLVPSFRKLDGSHTIHVTDLAAAADVVVVNELDTLKIYERMPNVTELEFLPGAFYHDRAAGKLYLTTSDMSSPETHHYSATITPTHGIYLANPKRVVIDGLDVTGFNADKELGYREGTLGGVWGIFLVNGKDCVIRNCRAYMNGWGIGLTSAEAGSGDNVIERCTAWANKSKFWAGDMGGLTIYAGRRDTIRDSTSFLNGMYGINIYGTGTDGGTYGDKNTPGNDDKNKSRLVNNLAWGNKYDFKIKTGVEYFHLAERCVGLNIWSITPGNVLHCIAGREGLKYLSDNIVLPEEKKLDLQSEFADPDNHDYHLQSTSRFRNAAPDKSDRGAFPYQANIFYVRADGNDSADGLSLGNAWKTLGRAIKALRPGDTVYLEPGTYQADIDLQFHGETGKPISFRGRGINPVVIQGGLRVKDSSQVDFRRLNFSAEVKVDKSNGIAFDNCKWTAEGTALKAAGVSGLRLTHCVFTGFQEAAIALKSCSKTYLAGNLFDERGGVALRMDSADSIEYSNYNSYRQTVSGWEVAGEMLPFAEVQKKHERQSRELVPEFTVKNGVAILKNPALFAASGPLGKPLGAYRDELRNEELSLIGKAEIHSVSATTANLEWMTSLPAACDLVWGDTAACSNRVSVNVNRFGSYSLTGLKPGQTYYFRIKSIRTPGDVDVKVIALKDEPISFTTLKENPAPAVYYVAPDGDNTRTGFDRKNAWRTIQHAAGKVNVGDTVLIAGGKYSERVRVRATGEIGVPITFKYMPGEKVTMDGSAKSLNNGFIAIGKNYLLFDGLHFVDLSMSPIDGPLWMQSGDFNLNNGKDITITRCFSDGRGGYTARSVTASNIVNLRVQNCVNIGKFGGPMAFNNCPDLRIENCVFAEPMIDAFLLRNKANENAFMENNIFTDMLEKKAALNIPMFISDSYLTYPEMRNNCYMVRCFPPAERNLFSDKTISQLEKYISTPLFADPLFAGDPGIKGNPADKKGFSPDRMMELDLKLDFDSFFATNPEVIKRGIGLQAEAFKDFNFNRVAPTLK
jgi:hypothetical protein